MTPSETARSIFHHALAASSIPAAFDRKVDLIVDEKLNRLKGKVLAPKKLADANKLLKQIKTLPK